VKKWFIIILSLLLFFTESFSQNKTPDELLREMVSKSGQARVTIPQSGIKAINDLSRAVSISSVRDKIVEIVLSKLTVEWFIAQHFDYTLLESDDSKGIVSATDILQAMEWDTYPSYTQYVSIMQDFPVLYPGLCRLDTIGTSNYGKLVLAVKISDNAGADEDEPGVFFSSTIHGDETGGFIMMLRLADYLLKNYNSDPELKTLVDNLGIWINPLANPDGTYGSGNLISSPVRFNANGYDLNRNFPDPEGLNTIRQKETLDMEKFLRRHKFILSANFHSGVEVVNFPWDRWRRLHADNDWFYHISRKYADTAHLYSPPWYMTFLDNGVTNGFDWYSINGGRQDFVTYELQGREVTIELDDEFVTPAANLNSLWEYNRRSLTGFLQNALYGIHGYVSDINTGDPVAARIFIQNHDKDSSHIYSDPLTGSFTRLLSPGLWDLTVSASGYVDVLSEDIIVSEGQRTVISIQMTPFINPVDTTDTPEIILYPNPAAEEMNAVLPEILFGRVKVTVYNAFGIKMREYYEEAAEDIPLRIDVSDMPGGVYILEISKADTGVPERKRFVVVHR
jgi:hypothetical protein